MTKHFSRDASTTTTLQAFQPDADLDKAADAFLHAMRAQGCSPKTLESYTFAVEGVLLPFARKRGLKSSSELSPQLLQDLSEDLNKRTSKTGRPLSKYSVKTYTGSVNRFMVWLGASPRAVRPVNLRRVSKPVLSLRQLRELEAAATTVRDSLIIRILADTGCRAGELCNLTLDDLRADQLVFNGKTDLERPVYITAEVQDRIRRYIGLQRAKDTRSNRIFLGLRKDKRTKDYAPLTPSGIRQMVKGIAEASAFEGKIFPHLFRHSAATRLGNEHVPAQIISSQLGMSVETLQRYSHPSPADMRTAMIRHLTENGE